MDATQGPTVGQTAIRGRSWLSFLLLVAVILVYVAVVSSRSRAPSGAEGPAIGRRLSYFRLEPLTGDSKPVSLEDLSGRVTVVNYWGTWCPPCVREFPEIVELAARFSKHDDFRLYAVSCGDSDSDADLVALGEETRQFLKANNYSLATHADQNAASRRAMTVTLDFEGGEMAYPTMLILDRNATIRGLWRGYVPGATREMAEVIEQLLKDAPIGPRTE